MTKLVIGKDRISVLEIDRFVSGTVDAYQCTATFSKDWEGLDREIIFRASPSDDPCAEVYGRVPAICMTMRFAIPSKLFAKPANRFQVTATGSRKGKSGAKVLSIPWASIGRIMEGAVIPPPCPDDDTPIIPGPVLNLAGGEKDDVLMKASDDDYDFTWGKIKSLPTVANSYVANAPIGSILFWSGSFTTIPQDWSLCDGQNGTPDLRDKMIIGASGDDQIGSTTSIYKVVDNDIDLTVPTYSLAIIMKTSHTPSGGEGEPSEPGTPGKDGEDGKSAYELAVEAGFEGTLEEWLKSLEGKDAYELAVEAGYTGTRQEFTKVLNDITLLPICTNIVITHKENIPPEGAGSYYFQNVTITAISKTDIPFKRDFVYLDDSDPTKLRITTLRNLIYDCYYDSDGNIISIEEVEIQTGGGEKGDPGKSAYEIAVEQGFTGTENEWLDSLHGAPGESAYEVAQKEGYQGTLEEWLASLQGRPGDDALTYAYVISETNERPILGENSWVGEILTDKLPESEFNRTPEVGESFIAPFNYMEGDTAQTISTWLGTFLMESSEGEGESKTWKVRLASITPVGAGSGGGVIEAKTIISARVPIGSIVMWPHPAEDIPTGWALCDGQNGTKDLRGRFILGVNDQHPLYETGGEENVTLTQKQMPAHLHKFGVKSDYSQPTTAPIISSGWASQSQYSNFSTSIVGGNSPHNNMPPFFCVYYIQKIAADETDGVTSFNGRTGDVTLTDEDISSLTGDLNTILDNINQGSAPSNLRTISLKAEPEGSAQFVGAGQATDGVVMTVKAELAEGKNFEHWMDGDKILGTSPELTLTVDGDKNLTAVSSDFKYIAGRDWRYVSVPEGYSLRRIAYGDGVYVITCYNSDKCLRSTDGVHWDVVSLPRVGYWLGVLYGNGLFVMNDYKNTDSKFIISTDKGLSWTEHEYVIDGKIVSYFYSDNELHFIGQNDNTKLIFDLHSSDGITWTKTDLSSISISPAYIAQKNNIIIGSSYGNSLALETTMYLYSNDDGRTWSELHYPTDSIVTSAVYKQNDMFVMYSTGNDPTSSLYVSYDGINWDKLERNVGQSNPHGLYLNGRHVSISTGSNTVLTSTNLKDWNMPTISPFNGLTHVNCYNNVGFAISTGVSYPLLVSYSTNDPPEDITPTAEFSTNDEEVIE